jgi:tRNA A-37 threonylcarbamoyl transferase component Bud32
MTSLIGRAIGQYEVIEEIGRGGMATVYRARQASMGRDVAIKVLPQQFTHDPTFLARFEREVQVAAQLQHTRILPVYDYGEFEGQPYIVMAYMPGGTLADRIAGGPLPLEEVVKYGRQIAEGLDYVHAQGVVHRDFKPSNVLLDKEGNAYIGDFGIARVQEATAHLTGTGILGTPPYMAPEVFREGEVSAASDLYALGVALYEMLTGQLPFEGETPAQVMRAHLEQAVPDVRRLRPELPPEVQQVMAQALAKNPARRYATASELAEALAEAVKAALSEEKRGRKRLRGVGLWAGLIVLIGAGGIGAYVGLGRERLVALTGLGTAAPTLTAVPTATPAPIETPTPTATLMPTETPVPTATLIPTPLPAVGGGTGILGFNANNLGYTVDVSCVLAGGAGCVPSPHILPQVEGMSPEFGAWSPDGRWIAFNSSDGLYIMTPDGSRSIRVAGDDYDWSWVYLAWSPDGTRLAYTVGRAAKLWVADVACVEEGGGDSCLTQIGDYAGSIRRGLFWSPDSTRLVFVEDVQEGVPVTYVITADGYIRHQLSRPIWAWMPDSDFVLFNDFTIARLDNTLSRPIMLGMFIYSMEDPVLLPDGRYLAFSITHQIEDYELYLLPLSCLDVSIYECQHQIVQVTDNDVDDTGASFSPDGSLLAFIRAGSTTLNMANGLHTNSGSDVYVLDVR